MKIVFDIVTVLFSRLEHSGSVDRVLGQGSKDSPVTVFNLISLCCLCMESNNLLMMITLLLVGHSVFTLNIL